MDTPDPLRLTLRCQTCRGTHVCTWPNLNRCPVCAALHPGPPPLLGRDSSGNARYGALPGDAQLILSGHVTDAMVFEQAAAARQRVSTSRRQAAVEAR